MRLLSVVCCAAALLAVPIELVLAGAPQAGWAPALSVPLKSPDEIPAIDLQLGPDDPPAALEAVQHALDQVGDGQAFVWYRNSGPLWGVVRPLSSFRAASGRPCRRLSLALSIGEFTRTTELVACRAALGWEVAG